MSNNERLLTIILLGEFIPIILLEAFLHVKYYRTNNKKYRKLILLWAGIGYLFGFLDLYVVDFLA
ncbi:hypothetical protein FMG_P0079 (plasmid) [Finegoldia magna ATCC 29328]|uniref:Uncharacterized protein n=1 Tax=Finegoldia magna (strain ATCC 29328 / DSM 20472 / WAL 2508) TaxID=334413 RepID=B0S4D7_FINM2|nr:hypothetical protein FMG_P0079 [Finegoldia magna ATCC 29328]